MKWPFGKKRTVSDLSLDELSGEQIRLETEEQRVLAKLEKAEDAKKRLFQQGAREASLNQKKVLARKIKEMDEKRRELDADASDISKQLRIVNKLSSIQRNKKKLKEGGLWTLIAKMSPEELDTMLTQAAVEGGVQGEKIRTLIEVIESDPRMTRDLDEDEDVLRIVEKMERAGETGKIDEEYSGITDMLDSAKKDTE